MRACLHEPRREKSTTRKTFKCSSWWRFKNVWKFSARARARLVVCGGVCERYRLIDTRVRKNQNGEA